LWDPGRAEGRENPKFKCRGSASTEFCRFCRSYPVSRLDVGTPALALTDRRTRSLPISSVSSPVVTTSSSRNPLSAFVSNSYSPQLVIPVSATSSSPLSPVSPVSGIGEAEVLYIRHTRAYAGAARSQKGGARGHSGGPRTCLQWAWDFRSYTAVFSRD
jgi:hypothetical protein